MTPHFQLLEHSIRRVALLGAIKGSLCIDQHHTYPTAIATHRIVNTVIEVIAASTVYRRVVVAVVEVTCKSTKLRTVVG